MNFLTPATEEWQKACIICHICGKFLSLEIKVADHCYLTGNYRAPAQNKCNLKYKVTKIVPIFFHNPSAYDCHFFIREFSSIKGRINIIPQNKELYTSISKRIVVGEKDLRFLDSFNFIPSSS